MLTLLRYSRVIKGFIVFCAAIAALISGAMWYLYGSNESYEYWCVGSIAVGALFIYWLRSDFAEDDYVFEDARDIARHDIYDDNSH